MKMYEMMKLEVLNRVCASEILTYCKNEMKSAEIKRKIHSLDSFN